MDLENRVRELEEDVLRLIDVSMDLEHRLETNEKFLRKLLHLLKDSNA